MKPTIQDFNAGVQAMAELIPFFPQSEAAQKFVVDSLLEVVESRRALNELTAAAINTMGHWASIATLRQIHAEICEQLYQEREQQEHERKLLQWQAEARKTLLPTPEEQAQMDGENRKLAEEWQHAYDAVSAWPKFVKATSEPGALGKLDRKLAEQAAEAPRLTEDQIRDRLLELEMALGLPR